MSADFVTLQTTNMAKIDRETLSIAAQIHHRMRPAKMVPRMNTEVRPPDPPDWTTFSPGTSFSKSGTVRSCLNATLANDGPLATPAKVTEIE